MKLPQVTLRELFLLVVIAAMGCGWWVEWQRRIRSETQAGSYRETILLLKDQLEAEAGGEPYRVFVNEERIERVR